MARCDTVAPGDSCCVDCDTSPFAIAILPGEHVDHPWSGDLTVIDYQTCSDCGCYDEADPFVAEYVMDVIAYEAISCLDETPCATPDASGEIWGAEAAGDVTYRSVPVSIPYEEAILTIEISDERDTHCDDGTTLDCADPLPTTCDPFFEIPAVQESCRRCVHLTTCGAWPYPYCKTDEECPDDEYCDPCANIGCPQCSSCTAGCLVRYE